MMGQTCVHAVMISPRFLALIDAPPMTIGLTFKIAVDGLLRCKAVYHTDVKDETAEKEWEVTLPRTSLFYKLLTGDAT